MYLLNLYIKLKCAEIVGESLLHVFQWDIRCLEGASSIQKGLLGTSLKLQKICGCQRLLFS